MGRYLNSKIPLEAYKEISRTRFFVDKTMLLEDVIDLVEADGQRYLCIMRPPLFGKSVMANMVAAFFGKAAISDAVFGQLRIASSDRYFTFLNHYSVIYIDVGTILENCASYDECIDCIHNGINKDLVEAYHGIEIDVSDSVWDNLLMIFQKIGERFVFVIDDWDAVFQMPFISREEQREFLIFLKTLLKDQAYVEFAYMTGVLPITKYSSGSDLNMFVEYDMAVMERFSDYFGFTEAEVDNLYECYLKTTKNPKITREELQIWYDGYHTASGERLYNPRSVVCALANNQLANYWISSGPYDEISFYVKNNIDDIRDELVLMMAGEGVETEIRNYAAVSMELNTKAQIYSAMVVHGLLTYMDGEVFIPNKELMDGFRELLMNKESMSI